jgi:uncharacterized membrane protein YgcG
MKRHSAVLVFLVFTLLGAVSIAQAQAPDPSDPAAAPQAQSPAQQVWSPAQLDTLVAPVALYPDPLLGQILVASTYPLEVVEANQWLQRNRNLRGQALVDAAKQQPWDPSIQALVAIPDALAKLNQDISWTTDLGNAFLAQQADVMSAVQRMRARAQSNGHLSSTPQQTVTTQDQGGQQAIIIQPASPQVIYVPTYDPWYIWGPPVYGYYPPLLYPAYGFGFGIGFDLGFCFGGWGGWGLWGWGPSWFGHTIFVNNFFFHHYGFHHGFWGGFRGRSNWAHDPVHRMHVPYASTRVAARFGGRSMGPGNSFRAGDGMRRGAAMPYAGRSAGPAAGRAFAQGSRNAAPQAQRYQNPPRQSYQPTQQYRPAPQQLREGPRVIPFGNQSQRNYQAPQAYRSAPQTYRAPQVQRFQPQPQMRFQAPQQYRSAPQFSAPRSGGGGNFSRSGGGGFSRGSGGGSSRSSGGSTRGGGGSRHR